MTIHISNTNLAIKDPRRRQDKIRKCDFIDGQQISEFASVK